MIRLSHVGNFKCLRQKAIAHPLNAAIVVRMDVDKLVRLVDLFECRKNEVIVLTPSHLMKLENHLPELGQHTARYLVQEIPFMPLDIHFQDQVFVILVSVFADEFLQGFALRLRCASRDSISKKVKSAVLFRQSMYCMIVHKDIDIPRGHICVPTDIVADAETIRDTSRWKVIKHHVTAVIISSYPDKIAGSILDIHNDEQRANGLHPLIVLIGIQISQ